MTTAIIALIAGFALGLAAAFLLRLIQGRTAAELLHESDSQRQQQIASVVESVKASFGSLSLEALSKSTEEFLKLAREKLDSQTRAGSQDLEAKKGLIDQQLKTMTGELEKVGKLMKELETDRAAKFGQLERQLRVAGEQTNQLMLTTAQLKEALASTKIRGQWGERMAEDVLRVAGFVEGINYRKQVTLEGSGRRPDFTFLLPRNRFINMDVKFPLENYLRFLECESAGDKANAEISRKTFLRDVKNRLKEVVGREYIDPAGSTVDYVLLFIPNEQIYAFIHDSDPALLDDSLRQHVVMCSPVTLFAVLSVIHQAVENFSLEMTSREILSLLAVFYKQWGEFVAKMEMMGKRLADAQKEYESLVTTRRNQLEKPLRQIEELRRQQGIDPASGEIPPPPEP
jgi:DNA recombination protein RmuC